MKNINEKITLKGLTCNIAMLVASNYETCIIDASSSKELMRVGFGKIARFFGGNKIQVPVKLDIISNGVIHKTRTGNYFTYRVSDCRCNEFKSSKIYDVFLQLKISYNENKRLY